MRLTVMFVTMALGLGCASAGHIPIVESQYWKDENFTDYRSYAWLASDPPQRAGTQAEDHRLHEMIRDAIDEQLAERGFVRSDARDADFLVTYHCKITEELRAEVIDRIWYGPEDQSEKIPRRVEFSSFDRGSIVIDFARPDGSRWVWRGVARGPVSLEATPEQLREVVDRSVREILSEFPPPN